MQTKTINRVITNKLTEWLASITDDGLRKDVKDNLLLSGGSIASMFLREDVNDYDIYLQDKKVLLRLVKYYTGEIKNRVLILTTENAEEHENRTGILGAAARTVADNQVKIFFPKGEDKGGIKLREITDVKDKEYKLMFVSPNALSLSDNIQIVTRFTGDETQIHSTFDFVHATNYFTFKTGLVTNIAALESLLTKTLKYQGSKYPLTSIIRFKKFVKRGWNISAGEILKIMFQISELDLKNVDVLEEQLIGIDVAYFSMLIEILRGVENVKITREYINTIIDKVFNEYDDDSNVNVEPPVEGLIEGIGENLIERLIDGLG